MRHTVLFIAITLLAPAVADADAGDHPDPSEFAEPRLIDRLQWEIGLAFQVGLPQEDFEGGTSYGFALFGGVRLPDLPVMLGADFGVLFWEGDRKTLEDTDVSSVDASVSPSVAMLHFVARLQPATGRFRPFLDALIGFKYFETRTQINEHYDGFGDPNDCIFPNCTRPVDNKKNSSDLAFSYGMGAGVDVQVFANDRTRVSVILGARYLFGLRAEYVDPSSIRIIDADTVEFETVRSRTDILTMQLGVSMQF